MPGFLTVQHQLVIIIFNRYTQQRYHHGSTYIIITLMRLEVTTPQFNVTGYKYNFLLYKYRLGLSEKLEVGSVFVLIMASQPPIKPPKV